MPRASVLWRESTSSGARATRARGLPTVAACVERDVRFLDTPRGRFALLERGRRGDPVVVCLHGFPDGAGSFTGLLDRLAAAGFHAVAPWLRGYDPAPTSGSLRGEALVADLLAQLDAIAPGQRVHLVGHDFGALVTYRALAQHAGRFGRSVTLAVPHPAAFRRGTLRHPAQLWASSYIALFQVPWLADGLVSWHDFAAVDWMWKRASPGYTPPGEHLAEVKRSLACSWPAPLEMYRAGGFATKRVLEVPVLALHGADDGAIHPEVGAGQERYLGAGSRHAILAGAGHWVHLERPGTVAERIVGWLGE